jgi:hypothetical protein
MTKLFEVPRNARIRIYRDVAANVLHDECLTFSYFDGIYALCYDEKGKPIHIDAFSEVKIIKEDE